VFFRGFVMLKCVLRARAVAALLLSVFVMSTAAHAQSSSNGTPLVSAATSRSLDAAIEDYTKTTIDQHLNVGNSNNNNNGNSTLSAYPTGRLRKSNHDGLRVTTGADKYGTNRTLGYETEERSFYLSSSYVLPGLVLGGRVKLGGLVGVNDLRVDQVGTTFGQGITAHNSSLMLGTSALWWEGSNYLLGSVVGFLGDTVTDKVGVAFGNRHYDLGSEGGIGTIVAGHVFDLPGTTGLKLDARAALSYSSHSTEGAADGEKGNFSSFWQTSSLMLYSLNQMPDGAVLKPYAQVNAKYLFDYDNTVKFLLASGVATTRFNQDNFYLGGELGVNHIKGAYTFGAAAYYEASKDETTFGGRFGVSIQLN
jgi:hypothetical protein